MPKAELKTVTVYEETKQRLKQRGEMDDSYNDVITRLLDETEDDDG
jgi:predicted CopG family antitoxin